MKLSIIILNYRTPELTVDCLRSIAAQRSTLEQLQVIVVDNASGDGSCEAIAGAVVDEGWGGWVMVHGLERNGGYAAGNNAGIRQAFEAGEAGGLLMILNPDTIVQAGAIRALVDFMSEHAEVGIAGSRLEDAAGQVQCSAHRFPTPWSELDGGARLGPVSRMLRSFAVSPGVREEAHECAWVSGSAMMIRRQVFEDAGLMDEGYFLYFDEVDFCARARRFGWSTWYVPASRVIHLEGSSTGIREPRRRRAAYWYESRRRFFVKHYGLAGLVAADVLWAMGRALFTLRRVLTWKANSDPRYFAWDLLWGDVKGIFSGRAAGIVRDGAGELGLQAAERVSEGAAV